MRFWTHLLSILFVFLIFPSALHAQTAPPSLATVSRLGAQRGTTVAVRVSGTNLGGARQVLWTGKGVRAKVTEAPPAPAVNTSADGKITLAVTIDPDAEPGVRQFRIVTPLGVTSAAPFLVGTLPEVEEVEVTAAKDTPQAVTLPVTINGRIDPAVDVDRYRFHARAGERLLFSVTAQPLGSPLDSLLVLRDASGQVLAENNDADDLDSLIIYTFSSAGDYTIEIRDQGYAGGPGYLYRLTFGAVPLVRSLYPPGGPAGQAVPVSALGENLPAAAMTLAAPKEAAPGQILSLYPGADANTGRPVPFAVSEFPEVMEREPNDDFKTAQPIAVPQTVNGRLFHEGMTTPDVDCFRFPGRKGERLVIEVAARRLGSTLDPVIEVLTATGEPVADARNDDAGGALGRDSRLEFVPPADGEYVVSLRDVAGASGERAIYRLSISRARPDFSLSVANANLTVPRGAGAVIAVNATRMNGFDGEIMVTVPNPPPGVSVTPGKVPSGSYRAAAGPTAFPANTLIGLVAAGEAPLGAATIRVLGTATIDGKTVTREALLQDGTRTGAPGGLSVSDGCLAVTETADVTIVDAPKEVMLKPGGKATFKVSLKRREGFKERVTLSVQGLPPGVTASTPAVDAEKNEGTITLTAAADAPPLTRPIYPGARSNPAGLTVPSQTTPAVTLTVAP